jgi:hypothetical protein
MSVLMEGRQLTKNHAKAKQARKAERKTTDGFGKVGGKENVENKNCRKRGDAKNHNINDDKQRGDDMATTRRRKLCELVFPFHVYILDVWMAKIYILFSLVFLFLVFRKTSRRIFGDAGFFRLKGVISPKGLKDFGSQYRF